LERIYVAFYYRYIGTRKNCHIFHKKRHFKPLKALFDDLGYRVELSHFPHSLREKSYET
jgi:hypothetical protein